jgi:predicted peptidase
VIKDISMWAFHGQHDPIIPLSNAQSVITTLINCGGSPLFTIYSDLFHDAWTRTYDNTAVYDWLLTHQKP